MKVWWNDEDWDIGFYDFMVDEVKLCSLYDILVKYRKWSENERKRTFKDGLYEAKYCLDGCSCNWVLKARTLEEAKKEIEQYFIEYYTEDIESAKRRIEYCEKILKAFNQ